MSQARSRPLFIFGLLGALSALAAAFVLEHWLGLVPCPLCLSQRLSLGAYAALCLGVLLQVPGRRGARLYAGALVLVALCGLALAARHVWLQGAWLAPSPEPAEHALQGSWAAALARQLVGSPECMSISWSFLDLTLPEWSLLAFVLLSTLPGGYLLAGRLRDARK